MSELKKRCGYFRKSRIQTFKIMRGRKGSCLSSANDKFHGTLEAGWGAVGICLAYGLPILVIRRMWYVIDANEPTGPHWEITFRERVY